MNTDASVMPQMLKKAMGWPQLPLEIPAVSVDGEKGVYRRLLDQSRPIKLGGIAVFWDDYHYMDLPRDLVRFVLPIALEAWTCDVLNTPGRFTGSWHFEGIWCALADKPMYPEVLNSDEEAAMEAFLADVLLLRMAREEGLLFDSSGASPYEWVRLLGTMIWHFPVAEKIWDHWLPFAETGHAVSFVQWISTLIYSDTANPFFQPWTPMQGGGPPAIFERIDLKECAAPAENSEFLRSALAFEQVEEALGRAVDALARHAQSDLAYQAWLDLSRRREFFENRRHTFLAMMESAEFDPAKGWDGL